MNRLVRITFAEPLSGQPSVIEFAYNGLGQRLEEKHDGEVFRRWLWADDSYQPIEERDAGNQIVKRFFEEIGEQHVATDTGGTNATTANYYYATDHLGSIREMTDATGAVRARYDYDPFGRRTRTEGDMDARFGFTGHLWHEESALSLTWYRAYDPELGRWISRDSLEEEGGMNLYAYCWNDSLNWIDPDGEIAIWGFVVGVGVDFVLQLISNGGNLRGISLGSLLLSGLAGATGFGLGGTLGKLGKLGKAGRALAKAKNKKVPLTKYMQGEAERARGARRGMAFDIMGFGGFYYAKEKARKFENKRKCDEKK